MNNEFHPVVREAAKKARIKMEQSELILYRSLQEDFADFNDQFEQIMEDFDGNDIEITEENREAVSHLAFVGLAYWQIQQSKKTLTEIGMNDLPDTEESYRDQN